jgi:hypothetical protein
MYASHKSDSITLAKIVCLAVSVVVAVGYRRGAGAARSMRSGHKSNNFSAQVSGLATAVRFVTPDSRKPLTSYLGDSGAGKSRLSCGQARPKGMGTTDPAETRGVAHRELAQLSDGDRLRARRPLPPDHKREGPECTLSRRARIALYLWIITAAAQSSPP